MQWIKLKKQIPGHFYIKIKEIDYIRSESKSELEVSVVKKLKRLKPFILTSYYMIDFSLDKQKRLSYQ